MDGFSSCVSFSISVENENRLSSFFLCGFRLFGLGFGEEPKVENDEDKINWENCESGRGIKIFSECLKMNDSNSTSRGNTL